MRPVFRSKNELIYSILHQSIIQGEFKPGTRLVIDELAAKLEVSPIPIREALRHLEADGFVSFEPHVGATITEIHTGLISEVFALLEAMEIITARAACQLMTADDLATMEKIISSMGAAVIDPFQWSQNNKTLHQFICDCAQMPLIKKMMQKALDHWDRLYMYYFRDVFANRIKIAQEEHWQILHAFKSGDPNTVEQIIRQHNRSALAAYLEHVQPDHIVPEAANNDA